jgi:hypothetical protein
MWPWPVKMPLKFTCTWYRLENPTPFAISVLGGDGSWRASAGGSSEYLAILGVLKLRSLQM